MQGPVDHDANIAAGIRIRIDRIDGVAVKVSVPVAGVIGYEFRCGDDGIIIQAFYPGEKLMGGIGSLGELGAFEGNLESLIDRTAGHETGQIVDSQSDQRSVNVFNRGEIIRTIQYGFFEQVRIKETTARLFDCFDSLGDGTSGDGLQYRKLVPLIQFLSFR